jgi:hypothetical protein
MKYALSRIIYCPYEDNFDRKEEALLIIMLGKMRVNQTSKMMPSKTQA